MQTKNAINKINKKGYKMTEEKGLYTFVIDGYDYNFKNQDGSAILFNTHFEGAAHPEFFSNLTQLIRFAESRVSDYGHAVQEVEVVEAIETIEVTEENKESNAIVMSEDEISLNGYTATMTYEGGNTHLKGEYKKTSIDEQKEKADILTNNIDGTCTIRCKSHVKVCGAGVKKKYDTFGDENVYEVTEKKLELLEKDYISMCDF